MSKRIKTLFIVVLIALTLLACNVENFVTTPQPLQTPALRITSPPPTLTPIPVTP